MKSSDLLIVKTVIQYSSLLWINQSIQPIQIQEYHKKSDSRHKIKIIIFKLKASPLMKLYKL